MNKYYIRISDEGKQFDNFVGYYLVFANSEKDAIEKLKNRCIEYDKELPLSGKIKFLDRSNDFLIAFSTQDVILIDYDSYN